MALQVLTEQEPPVNAVALVNPGLRIRTAVGLVEGLLGQSYRWTADARQIADELDFVARAGDLTTQPPLLVRSEQDHRAVRTDAADLAMSSARYTRPDEVELVTVPDLAHPLVDEAGLEPAPQLPATRAVDEILTQWFLRQFTAK